MYVLRSAVPMRPHVLATGSIPILRNRDTLGPKVYRPVMNGDLLCTNKICSSLTTLYLWCTHPCTYISASTVEQLLQTYTHRTSLS